ncbi:MAG TPA: YfiR family protein [Terracidiphilus sp.]|nr:YfiR family protein [Terracidiphilus sp.]
MPRVLRTLMLRVWFAPVRSFARGVLPVMLAVALLSAAAPVEAQHSQSEVEAAYLLNFGKFMHVAPPAQAGQRNAFDICIVGRDRIGKALEGLVANEQIDNRPVRVRQLTEAREARNCDIAYLSAEGERIDADLDALKGADVLTVSDAPDFLGEGGMIQLLLSQNHVRFSVNLRAVRQTHLTLSSELLKVAVAVTGAPAGEGAP